MPENPSFNELFEEVRNAGTAAFADLRTGIMDTARVIIVHQLRQIATAVYDVLEGVREGDYTSEGAAELLQMARRAAAVAISGATELFYTEVEAAVNRIYAVVRNFLSGALDAVLDKVL